MVYQRKSFDIEARASRRCYVFVAGATAMSIATAALVGAGVGATVGGVTAAISGGDVGKGILFGGLGGALTGGVGSAISGAGAGAAGGVAGGTEGGVASAAADTSSNMLGSGIVSASKELPTAAQIGQEEMVKEAATNAADSGTTAFSKGLSGMGNKLWTAAKDNPFTTIGLAGQGITALAQPQYTLPKQTAVAPYHSQSQLSPNYKPSRPASYTPSMTYDEGGIVAATDYDTPVDANTGAAVGFAAGGPVNKFYAQGLQMAQQAQAQQPQPQAPQPQGLPGYARGRMVHGAGTGVSDGIPALIDGEQPAAIASGEYVIPARAVSEIGQGSSDAGAKRLDAMVAKVQQHRAKTMGKQGIAKDSKAYKALLA